MPDAAKRSRGELLDQERWNNRLITAKASNFDSLEARKKACFGGKIVRPARRQGYLPRYASENLEGLVSSENRVQEKAFLSLKIRRQKTGNWKDEHSLEIITRKKPF